MEFRILGHVEVLDGDRVLPLRGSRERALLAYFVLHANEILTTERLIDDLWGPTPPATVAAAVHVYVSRLRKLLGNGDAALVTQKPGYVLRVEPENVDLFRFERLVELGRRLHMQGDAAAAAQSLRQALALWRGAPLADAAEADWAHAEIARLEELRLAAIEDRVEADLELGRHADLVGELEVLVAGNPLRERLRAQLILALYRCGRHGEALQAYGEARRVFSEELGLEPSAALRRLEKAILEQDPSLELSGEVRVTHAKRRPSRAVWAVATAATLAAAAAGVAVASREHRTPVRVVPNSIAVIDARSGRIVDDVPIGGTVSSVAAGAGGVWVADSDDGTVARIDPATAEIRRTIGVGPKPRSIAVGSGSVWALRTDRLVRIDPGYDHVTGTTRLRQRVPGGPNALGYGWIGAVAVGPAGVWVSHGVSAISEIDPRTSAARRNVFLDDTPVGLGVGNDVVWAFVAGANELISIDPATGAIEGKIRVPLGIYCSGDIVATPTGIWLPSGDHVWQVDPLTDSVVAGVATGAGAQGVAVDGDSVWVANYLAGTVSRVDTKTKRVVATVRTGNNPTGLAVARGRVWVAVN